MTEAAVLLGVDIVERGRLRRMISELGDPYRRQIAAPAERARHADRENGDLLAAAAFAVKECLIKAVGGRPPGFRWHDFAPATSTVAIDRDTAALLDEAAAGVGATTGIELTTSSTYAVRGASRVAALARLAPGQDEPCVTGAARWGLNDNVIVALAVVTATEKGAPGCP